MDTDPETNIRTFVSSDSHDELYISKKPCVQAAEQRFGQGIREDLRAFVYAMPGSQAVVVEDDFAEDEDEDDEEFDEFMDDIDPGFVLNMLGDGDAPHDHHSPQGFPRIGLTRNNLTALSQRYNLYFAAYQDRIYVYQPQRCGPQILPSPSLILQPRPSKIAEKLDAAAMDFHFPHQINHIIVGNLGDLEIVLFAYDDGDVAAYYTHSIARCIRASAMHMATRNGSQTSRGPVQPPLFFHENVLKSAWGLAIHSQSRIIAVGSNLHEVTVFAFALSAKPGTNFPAADNASALPDNEGLEKERRFPTRTITWRIVLPLGRYGSNIPNLTFIDDERGDADKIAAIDVCGSLWILDIWTRSPPMQWKGRPGSDPFRPGGDGWGVLVLPFRTFKTAKTVQGALGVPGNEVERGAVPGNPPRLLLDITCGLFYVKELAADLGRVFTSRINRVQYTLQHAGAASRPDVELSDADEDEDDSEDEASDAATPPSVPKPGASSLDIPVQGLLPTLEGSIPCSQCVIPALGEAPQLHSMADYVQFSKPDGPEGRAEKVTHIEHSDDEAKLPAHLVSNFCILRTSKTNVELVPFDRNLYGVECKMVLTAEIRADQPWDMNPTFSERLSMLIHVPELSLVAMGSPSGHVALITLTRTDKLWRGEPLKCGFRIERILPRKSEEKIRPRCTLIGIAVSPVPCRPGRDLRLRPGRARRGRSSSAPAMYRLIMHYKDHTILQYEFSRGEDSEELLVC
ncbi:hypothetical protein VTJ83DRAFT_268 [Remersonia thermophila]|uniref:C2 domain-containing protein n=1 Tax=Remersonia thermophila TaxID=72144 RepID=A0ABR4DKS9_9PEZI